MDMTSRKQKIEGLMESFHSLRRSMAFRPSVSSLAPRITPSQWGVIMFVGHHADATVKDVAQALRISSSAASQLIDGLVEAGYVTREQSAEDRRRVTLVLSKKTRGKIDTLKRQRTEQFLKLFAVLSDEEFDQYIALSQKIALSPRKH